MSAEPSDRYDAGMAVRRQVLGDAHVDRAEAGKTDLDIPFQDLIFRDIRVRGSLISSPREAREMLKLVAEHGISVTTNAFNGLGEIEELVRLAGSGKMKGKGIIVMDAGQIGKEREKVGGGEVA